MSVDQYHQDEDAISDNLDVPIHARTPHHYEEHQMQQTEKIQRLNESEKLAKKMGKSMERISHSGDARWGDAPMKALQQLKQMDNMLLGNPTKKKLSPEERSAAILERHQRLAQLSQPRVVYTTRFQLAETRQEILQRYAAPNNKAEIGELLLNNPLGITIPGGPRQRANRAHKVKKGKKKGKGKGKGKKVSSSNDTEEVDVESKEEYQGREEEQPEGESQ